MPENHVIKKTDKKSGNDYKAKMDQSAKQVNILEKKNMKLSEQISLILKSNKLNLKTMLRKYEPVCI